MDAKTTTQNVYPWALPKGELESLHVALKACGYEVHGPQVEGAAIVYGPLETVEDLPHGMIDQQNGGYYRIQKDPTAGTFDHVVGPNSLKEYLFPPKQTLQKWKKTEAGWVETTEHPTLPRVAIIGARSCDLRAIAIQDRVFLEGTFSDATYQRRRENLLLISIQCRRSASTCFCASMNAGPKASSGFDLAITELEHTFLFEVGSDAGQKVLDAIPNLLPASLDDQTEAAKQSQRLAEKMLAPTLSESNQGASRQLDTHGLPELLINNLEHPIWEEIGKRCLSCANCTMVCPTCFCSTVNEVTQLTDEDVLRERSWSSCFNAEHSYTASGVVHASTASRYRQWLTHKLSTWHDQFGTSGCVGCGRCITWCPVGIDFTEEVTLLRSQTS
jgi:sulfhydrogenase subunit beta (sulfur reductase)